MVVMDHNRFKSVIPVDLSVDILLSRYLRPRKTQPSKKKNIRTSLVETIEHRNDDWTGKQLMAQFATLKHHADNYVTPAYISLLTKKRKNHPEDLQLVLSGEDEDDVLNKLLPEIYKRVEMTKALAETNKKAKPATQPKEDLENLLLSLNGRYKGTPGNDVVRRKRG